MTVLIVFPFAKRNNKWGSRYESKNNWWVSIRIEGNPYVSQALESIFFIADRAIGVQEALFNS